MKVAVQKREVPRSRRLTFSISLGFAVVSCASVAVYRWANSHYAERIVEMGGDVSKGSGLTDNFRRVWGAWGKQREAATDAPTIPTLHFDLRRKNIGKLAVKRNEALEKGYLVQEPGDFVPADIRVTNGTRRKKVRAKIRLKGDFIDHLRGDKWSFRVRVSGDDQILGMRVFSIQHPKVRGYAHENLVLEHMRREGVLAPRYEFVRVVINGRDKGIMALEEHFSKELLESQHRRESVIVRFDESLKWRTIVLMGQTVDFSAPYPLVTPFQSGKVSVTPNLTRDLQTAVSLLRGFLSRDLAPSAVFDPEVTARFLAVAEIWGAEHTLSWNNIRFYFNPITGLLEPIAFDCNLQDAAFMYIPSLLVSVYRAIDNMTADWLEDPRIRGPFLRELRRISTEHAKTVTWERYAAREKELHKILHQEFPLIRDVGFAFYRIRAERLARIDEDNFRSMPLMPPNYPVLMHAFVQPTTDGQQLELYNLVPYPLNVTEITFESSAVKMSVKVPFILPPTRGMAAPTPIQIQLEGQDVATPIKTYVTANIVGYPITKLTKKTLKAKHYSPKATAPVLPEVTWSELLAKHRYVVRDGNTAKLGPGEIRIKSPLILPRGGRLTVAPGTQLQFRTGAFLLARGPVHMMGTATAPIDIGPTQVDFPGMAVLDAAEESVWTHVRVHDTRGLAFGSWMPTGSVMFYQSKVKLVNCTFKNSKSEDMLNLVRCDVVLESVTVEGCKSDAIDMDFCTGSVRGGLVRDIQGDGMDVSGTTLDLRGMRFDQIKDKAISCGEGSTLTVDDVHISNTGTGLASKDSSKVTISNSTFEDIKFFAVIAYMKKPEYGFGHVTASKLIIEGSGVPFRAQKGSSIEVDGKMIPPVDVNVDALYTVGPMRKEK